MRGIEIAPWFNPLAPKRQGFNCLVLDVFDQTTLLERAKNDPNIVAERLGDIEPVDLVGSATEIAQLVDASEHGAFEYIISSHNFEHLPNPIRFLQGCQKVLKPGGLLSMAVPDARACFDHFRPHTTTGEWLSALLNGRDKPTGQQIFDSSAYFAALSRDDRDICAFSLHDDTADIRLLGDIGAAYQSWLSTAPEAPYRDAHCSVLTPASFELLIAECNHLGLISMTCESVSEPSGCEFFVRLVNSPSPVTANDFKAIRTDLARRIWSERAESGRKPVPPALLPFRYLSFWEKMRAKLLGSTAR